ncbi:SDR family NAD(P)-dependent oxidoreductase [Streptomyces inhibens]|uniref:SDR family NAD(P)-dependent oxidoreductase n=1 Tax=Streptomyces inhibens TaxID=2293571 RepID=A0A371PX35_STRIH|nr:SDR family oxidoreductase [Streptomyces inhibens]REK87044.1 SDR family NAD(P)-dependent oxidoreductase [Streptomyces inhibens]
MARAGQVAGTATAARPTLPAPATRGGHTTQTAPTPQEAREGGAAPRKVAVVTGAGSGIGRAVAHALVAANWTVVLAGRRAEALAETARLVGHVDIEAPTIMTVPTDVTRPDEVDALFTAVRDRFSRLDLLFNNAGTFGKAAPLDELAYDDWRAVVDVNLTGAFLCAQAAFRTMKGQDPQGGRIINNGSISAHTPRPHSIAYTATKHAMTGLTKSLSLDGRPYQIACGQIDIGNAATDMTGRMQTGILQANGQMAVEPVMDAADVARTVVHMAALPLAANVQFATVLATNMPYIGRG